MATRKSSSGRSTKSGNRGSNGSASGKTSGRKSGSKSSSRSSGGRSSGSSASSSSASGGSRKRAKRGSGKRELIAPRGDKRFARRDGQGQFEKNQDDVGRSLSQDRRKRAKRTAKRGHGDEGDREE